MRLERLGDVQRILPRFSYSSSSDEVESSLSDEPLATSDDDGDTINVEDDKDADEDGLTSAMLLRHFENTEPVSTW